MLQNSFKFDGKEFNDRIYFAHYLKKNFKRAVSYIADDTLLTILKEALPELYHRVMELSKDYEHKENVLTLIIYLLDNSAGINTPNYYFRNCNDIAAEMKKSYPNINPDVKVLFQDKVLAHIFWDEYNRTYDARYKRNYIFMLHIYENKMHEFSYYYFLFLHLAKNEVVRFTFDGLKMKSLVEINMHLTMNIDRSSVLIEEILKNPFILALMAVESGIDTIAAVLSSKQSFEILKLLETYGDFDLTPIVCRKMAFWLMVNYKNYSYETDEAKVLQSDYNEFTKNLTLTSLSDYVAIYDDVTALYRRFVNLYNHNKLISFRIGISSTDEYYLNYRFNEEYVCKKFLLDNGLFDETIHTDIHCDSVEREVLVDVLEIEKEQIRKFRDEVASLTRNISFDKKMLANNIFVSIMFLIFAIVSVFGSFFLGLINKELLSDYINLGMLGLLGLSIVLLIICVIRYSKKLSNAELIDDALENSLSSIEDICKEEAIILNPNNVDFSNFTFDNLSKFQKNRKKDLTKVKKIVASRTNVSNALLIISITLALVPILQFGLSFVLQFFNIVPYELTFGFGINLIPLIVSIVNLVLLIIFRKKGYSYYFIFLYIALITIISLII